MFRVRRLVAFAFLGLASLGACGDGASSGAAAAGGPIVARFKAASATPDLFDVPFPSDAYITNGHFGTVPGIERLFPQNGDFFAQQLARMNGWSRIAPAVFAIDDLTKPPNADSGEPAGADVDRASLPATEDACKADGSSVFFLDLDSGERIGCRALVDDERAGATGRMFLAVGPARGIVLEEGRRYLAVLTSRVKDTAGHPLAATADFEAAAVRKSGPLAALYGAAYDKAKASLGPALGADTIVALAPYTTQAVTKELYALRDALEAAPAPALAWDGAAMAPMGAVKFAAKVNGQLPAGFTASLDDWLGVVAADKKLPDGVDDPDEVLPVRAHDKVAAFGTAVFDAVNYLQKRPNGYDDVEHGTFARDAAGNPVPAPEAPTAKVWISFAIPTAPMPAGGYPVVIVQHGLSSSRQYLVSLMNTFCAKGWMAVAIDSVTFGARASDPKFRVDATTDYAGTGTYNGPDGISDLVQGERAGPNDLLGNLKNIRAAGDQLRQASFDTTQVVKLLRSGPDLSPLAWNGTTPKIDPDRIAYVGDSLGAIEGATAAAVEPHVKAWTLNVGGGGILVEIVAHSPEIGVYLSIAGSLNYGLRGVTFTEAHPLVGMAQTVAEPGDPLAFAKYLVTAPAPLAGQPTAPRNILQTEVLYDHLVTNEGGEALARAGGWGMATPNVGLNSGMADLSGKKTYPGGGVVLPFLQPDSTGFHDTPVAGTTALVAQLSPAVHGEDLVRSVGTREYGIPFNTELGVPSVERGTGFKVPCPYRPLQAAITGFFASAFDGKPVVTGLPTPVRDADGDGRPDDTDPAPLDSTR